MKAFRQGAQSAAVAGGSKSWGTTSKRRPGAAVQDQNKSGNMGDRLIDKRLTTQIMRKRRQKNLRDLDAQVQDILDGKTGAFFPFAPKEFTGWGKWKHLIWAVVELPDDPSPMAYAVTAWILGLVSISSFTAVIETLPSLRLELANVWVGLEFFFMVNFSIEFVLRVISCPDMRQFVTVGLNWVDAVVIIPFWFEEIMALFYGSGTLPNVTFLRLLRLGKGIRLVKLGRFSRRVRMLHQSLAQSWDALQLFLVILLMSVVVCASMMYYAERGEWIDGWYYRTFDRGLDPTGMYELEDQSCWYAGYNSSLTNLTKFDCKRVISPFQSVPHSVWFAIITLMTVGYGEVVPLTYNGQFFGIITVLIGILTLVLPLSIIQSSFVDERRRMKVEDACEKAQAYIKETVQVETLHDHKVAAGVEEDDTNEDARLKEAQQAVDFNLLPTLITLATQLRATRDQMPKMKQDAQQCVDLLQRIRTMPRRRRKSNGNISAVRSALIESPPASPEPKSVASKSPVGVPNAAQATAKVAPAPEEAGPEKAGLQDPTLEKNKPTEGGANKANLVAFPSSPGDGAIEPASPSPLIPATSTAATASEDEPAHVPWFKRALSGLSVGPEPEVEDEEDPNVDEPAHVPWFKRALSGLSVGPEPEEEDEEDPNLAEIPWYKKVGMMAIMKAPAPVYVDYDNVRVTHKDAQLAPLPGSRLTGKEYMVDQEVLKELYSLARGLFLSSLDHMKDWEKAEVEDVQGCLSPKSQQQLAQVLGVSGQQDPYSLVSRSSGQLLGTPSSRQLQPGDLDQLPVLPAFPDAALPEPALPGPSRGGLLPSIVEEGRNSQDSLPDNDDVGPLTPPSRRSIGNSGYQLNISDTNTDETQELEATVIP